MNKNELGLSLLKEKYDKLLKFVISNILAGHDSDIEECLNDTYFNLWNGIESYNPKVSSIKNYAVVIARNIAKNRLRTITTRSERMEKFDVTDMSENITDTAKNMEEKFILKEDVKKLQDISDQSEPIYSDDYDEWKQEMSYKRNNQFLCFTPAKAQIAGMKFISGEYNALSHTSEDGEKLSDGSINVVYRKNKTDVDNDYGFSLKVYTTFKYDSIDKIGNNIYSFSIRYGDVGLMCYKNTIKDEVKIGNFEGENVTDEYNVYNMGIDIYADCTPKEFEEILDSIQENVKTLEKK